MKLFISALMMLIPIQSYAFPITKSLYCSNPDGFAMFVDVTVTDQDNYQVFLRDRLSNAMPFYQSLVTFNYDGEIQSISASGTVELLELRNLDENWVGTYWMDNVRFNLSCSILN